MISEAVAKRYAQALFGAADARGLLEPVAADVRALAALLQDHPELSRALAAPQVSAEAKRGLVRRLLGGRVHPLVVELLELLMEKKRLAVLRQTIEGYCHLVEAHQGVIRAEVTTARPIPQSLEEGLVAKLERRLGKRVLLEKRVDASIIGGMMVRVEDRIIEHSIRRTLEQIRRQLLEVPVYE